MFRSDNSLVVVAMASMDFFWPYAHISKQLMNLTSNFFFIWPSSCKNVRIISLLSIDRHRRRRCPRFLQKEISHVHRLVWLDPIVRRSQSDFQFRSIKASIGTRGRVQWLIFASKVASKLSYIASDRMKDSIRRVFS